MKSDSKRIRQIMARAHMTVNGLAKAAGLPSQTTAAIICGMNVQPDTLARIAQGVEPILKTNGRAGREPPQELAPPLPAGQVRVNVEKFTQVWARSGLTVKQLAERAGVSPAVIRSIKRGAEAHKAATVDKLADALGVAVYNIIKREENT